MLKIIEDRFARDEIITRAEVLAHGGTDRSIRSALAAEEIVRIRNGVFALPELDRPTHAAVRVGGRLGCVSELDRLGVWVIDRGEVHVHLLPTASRLRSVSVRVIRHWTPLIGPSERSHVAVIDALVQAVGCLPRREMVAAFDSAVHLGLIEVEELRRVPDTAVRGYVDLIDGSAESGLESMLRIQLRDVGLDVRSQVSVAGLGRVDLMVEGRIIVEADGDSHHSTYSQRFRDRDRDLVAVAAGFGALRYGYRQVVDYPDRVTRAVVNAVRIHRGVKGAGRIAQRAQRRLDTPYLS